MFGFKTRSSQENQRVTDLEKRVNDLESRFSRVTADVLDATERLERVTRRAFRLREQLDKLEGKPAAQEPQFGLQDAEGNLSPRQALLRRWMSNQ
jgi:septal ring factor EnvC (AmiA/AmiB activator)